MAASHLQLTFERLALLWEMPATQMAAVLHAHSIS